MKISFMVGMTGLTSLTLRRFVRRSAKASPAYFRLPLLLVKQLLLWFESMPSASLKIKKDYTR